MVIRVFTFGFLLFITTINTSGVQAQPVPPDKSFAQWQDSLQTLGMQIYQEEAEPDRLKANFSFVRTLVAALQTSNSYSFDFDSLHMISIRKSPDNRFRIFSWHVPLSDGSYLYYGTIQLNTPDGSLKLYPLLDVTYEIRDPESVISNSTEWYGAQYYEIIPYQDSYILLGWKGHNPLVTQKVIEVLTIDQKNDQAILGKKIFNAPETTDYSRIIYHFSQQVSMHLAYDPEHNRIVFDHLVPSDEKLKGQYEHYGPDLSFDAWYLGKELLELQSHIVF